MGMVLKLMAMEIKILRGVKNSHKATGLTVVIDVFRAFSTSCYLMQNGAISIIPVESVEKATELKQKNPDFVLCGERDGYKPKGFDFGNSPSEIKNSKFNKKTIVLTTTLGTKGLMGSINAKELITGSFVNLNAVVGYILRKNPKKLSLLCTGTHSNNSKDEDYMCAYLIVNKLRNSHFDFNDVIRSLVSRGYADHFFNSKIMSHPKEDFYLCTTLNKFNFVLRAENYGQNYKQLRSYLIA